MPFWVIAPINFSLPHKSRANPSALLHRIIFCPKWDADGREPFIDVAGGQSHSLRKQSINLDINFAIKC